MKKICIILLFICIGIKSFGIIFSLGIGLDSIHTSSGISTNDELLNYTGIGINTHIFWGNKFGYIQHMNMTFYTMHLSLGENIINSNEYSYILIQDNLFGLGYKFDVHKSLQLLFGFGFHMLIMLPMTETYDTAFDFTEMKMGIGGLCVLYYSLPDLFSLYFSSEFG